jgi:hypothetical protein
MNLLTPERVQRAARLIRTGTIIEIGRVLEPAMPFFGTRRFDVHLKRSGPPAGANRLSGNEEVAIGEIGHVGTQLDGFPRRCCMDPAGGPAGRAAVGGSPPL